METEHITHDLVERTLRNYQRALEPPSELLELHILTDTGVASRVELQIKLYELLISLVEESINGLRHSEEISHLADLSASPMASMTADFKSGNRALRNWSTLYHRYLATPSLSTEELATVAHVAPRHIRRFLKTGIGYLVSALQRAELNVHRRRKSVRLQRHLPPPEYRELIGVELLRHQLVSLLEDLDGPRFISLEGLGGCGKTALAQSITYNLAEGGKLEDIFWISAREEFITYQGELKRLDTPINSLEHILIRLTQQVGLQELSGLSIADRIEKLKAPLSAAAYL